MGTAAATNAKHAGVALPSPALAPNQDGSLLVVLAVALPALLAYNLPPSPTLLNQLAAIGLWGLALLGLRWPAPLPWLALLRSTRPLLLALGLVAGAALGTWAFASLPAGLAWSSCGGACCCHGGGCGWCGKPLPARCVAGLCDGCVLLGTVSTAVAWVQVFAPTWADGQWIARSTLVGRAVGNVRQPNHLATLMLGAAAALVPWAMQSGGFRAWPFANRSRARLQPAPTELKSAPGWLRPALAWILFALFVATVNLSGSRTGALGVGVLALWGLLDKRLPGRLRLMLPLGPLVFGATWVGMDWWAQTQGAAFGSASRLGGGDISSSRFAIWRDTLALIGQHPVLGVGFGEFNLAWSMTAFANRPIAFFDHSHNAVLQLAVELGLPLGLLVCALLALALWQGWQRTWRADHRGQSASDVDGGGTGLHQVTLRTLWVMVLLMVLHSQLEYPLWYAHFLLPTAFAWGVCLGVPRSQKGNVAPAAWRWALPTASAAMLLVSVLAAFDYRRVVVIFEPSDSDHSTLTQRIDSGRRSWFFAHHADYAWATTAPLPGDAIAAFDTAKHHLLDARLMMAWAQAYAEQGDVERARHIAARLREFRNPATQAFFDECKSNAFVQPPFQCTAPKQALDWRSFR